MSTRYQLFEKGLDAAGRAVACDTSGSIKEALEWYSETVQYLKMSLAENHTDDFSELENAGVDVQMMKGYMSSYQDRIKELQAGPVDTSSPQQGVQPEQPAHAEQPAPAVQPDQEEQQQHQQQQQQHEERRQHEEQQQHHEQQQRRQQQQEEEYHQLQEQQQHNEYQSPAAEVSVPESPSTAVPSELSVISPLAMTPGAGQETGLTAAQTPALTAKSPAYDNIEGAFAIALGARNKDQAGDYLGAFDEYCSALQLFEEGINELDDNEQRAAVEAKVSVFEQRAGELHDYLAELAQAEEEEEEDGEGEDGAKHVNGMEGGYEGEAGREPAVNGDDETFERVLSDSVQEPPAPPTPVAAPRIIHYPPSPYYTAPTAAEPTAAMADAPPMFAPSVSAPPPTTALYTSPYQMTPGEEAGKTGDVFQTHLNSLDGVIAERKRQTEELMRARRDGTPCSVTSTGSTDSARVRNILLSLEAARISDVPEPLPTPFSDKRAGEALVFSPHLPTPTPTGGSQAPTFAPTPRPAHAPVPVPVSVSVYVPAPGPVRVSAMQSPPGPAAAQERDALRTELERMTALLQNAEAARVVAEEAAEEAAVAVEAVTEAAEQQRQEFEQYAEEQGKVYGQVHGEVHVGQGGGGVGGGEGTYPEDNDTVRELVEELTESNAAVEERDVRIDELESLVAAAEQRVLAAQAMVVETVAQAVVSQPPSPPGASAPGSRRDSPSSSRRGSVNLQDIESICVETRTLLSHAKKLGASDAQLQALLGPSTTSPRGDSAGPGAGMGGTSGVSQAGPQLRDPSIPVSAPMYQLNSHRVDPDDAPKVRRSISKLFFTALLQLVVLIMLLGAIDASLPMAPSSLTGVGSIDEYRITS